MCVCVWGGGAPSYNSNLILPRVPKSDCVITFKVLYAIHSLRTQKLHNIIGNYIECDSDLFTLKMALHG